MINAIGRYRGGIVKNEQWTILGICFIISIQVLFIISTFYHNKQPDCNQPDYKVSITNWPPTENITYFWIHDPIEKINLVVNNTAFELPISLDKFPMVLFIRNESEVTKIE